MRASVGSQPVENPRPLVYVRQSWADGWQLVEQLDVASCARSVAPGTATASLVWHIGRMLSPGWSDFRNVYAIDLTGWYVRIDLAGPGGSVPIWYGIIDADAKDLNSPQANGAMGRQQLSAHGLELALEQWSITQAKAEAASVLGPGHDVGDPVNIGMVPDFNGMGPDGVPMKNRTSVVDETLGIHLFGSSEYWTNLDILNYLLALYQPAGTTQALSFVLAGQYSPLAEIVETHRLEGLNLREALTRLIDRRRGLLWWTEVVNDIAYIVVDTAIGAPADVDGWTMPANSRQIPLKLDNERTVEKLVVQQQWRAQIDRIEVVGDPIEITSTFSGDGFGAYELTEDWESTDKIAYDAATGSNDTADAAANDATRRTDDYRNVYSRFKVSPTWDGTNWLYWDGEGLTGSPHPETAEERANILPTCSADGTLDFVTPRDVFKKGLRINRYLPYAGPDGDRVPPLVLGLEPEKIGSAQALQWRFFQVDSLGTDGDTTRPGTAVRVSEDSAAISLRSTINHVWALNRIDSGAATSNVEAAFDYYWMLATMTIQTSERLRVVKQLRPASAERGRVMQIQVEGAGISYIAPGTVIGLDDGSSVTKNNLVTHVGGYARNDAARLRRVAALAAAWYGQPRSTVQIDVAGRTVIAPLGAYVTQIADQSGLQGVGTIVTDLSWDFGSGGSDLGRTSMQTDYWTLDVARVGLTPGIGRPRELAREIQKIRADLNEIRKRNGNVEDRRAATSGGQNITGLLAVGWRTAAL